MVTYKKMIIKKDVENEIINSYLNNISTPKISNSINLPIEIVQQILKSNGVSLRNQSERSKKYICNENIFDEIDNYKKAYWLGMFYSDGYVTKKNYIGITLAINDLQHLHKFKKFLNASNPIYIRKATISSYCDNENCRIIICRSNLGASLSKFGITSDKKDTTPINNLKNELKIHVVRGMIDGDGCICYTLKKCKNKNDYKEFSVSYSGNLNLVEYINKFIQDNKIAKRRRVFKYNNCDKSYYINLQGNKQVKKFLDLIYENADESCYLERKHKIYSDLCDYIKEFKKWKRQPILQNIESENHTI